MLIHLLLITHKLLLIYYYYNYFLFLEFDGGQDQSQGLDLRGQGHKIWPRRQVLASTTSLLAMPSQLLTRDVASANRSRSASAASGLQAIATVQHTLMHVIAKTAKTALVAISIDARYVGFFHGGSHNTFSGQLELGLAVPVS